MEPTTGTVSSDLPASPAELSDEPMSLRRYNALVGWGLLVTNLGQMVSIGLYPIRFLLKDELHLSALQMATWSFWAILPWSVKPIAGLISDAVPIRGMRRRYYLLIGTSVAALCWLAMGVAPRAFAPLLGAALGFNIAAVFVSVSIGGLLVEGARDHGATGWFSSLRLIIINISAIVSGPVGGFLASRRFMWTTWTGAALFISMVPITLLMLRETPIDPRRQRPALRGIVSQITTIFRCKTIWIAGGLFFLVQLSPGFSTPLLYYQSDTLKFSKQFIGNLGILSGGVGLLASFIYPLVCRRLRLRVLLVLAIVCSAMTTLAYLGYVSWRSAMIIEAAGGLGVTLGQLPLFDLAARATPVGSEALAYSIMIAFWNIGLSLSDVLGSALYGRYHFTFRGLVWINATTTALVLLAIPFLPGALVDHKEGELAPSAAR